MRIVMGTYITGRGDIVNIELCVVANQPMTTRGRALLLFYTSRIRGGYRNRGIPRVTNSLISGPIPGSHTRTGARARARIYRRTNDNDLPPRPRAISSPDAYV